MALAPKPEPHPPVLPTASFLRRLLPFRRDASVKPAWLILAAALLVPLNGLYLYTARVYFAGSLAENILVLKPQPSFDTYFVRSENGWKPSHPGEPMPWWESEKTTHELAFGGDWEDPVWWNDGYDLGTLLVPVLYLFVIYGIVRDVVRLGWRAIVSRRAASSR